MTTLACVLVADRGLDEISKSSPASELDVLDPRNVLRGRRQARERLLTALDAVEDAMPVLVRNIARRPTSLLISSGPEAEQWLGGPLVVGGEALTEQENGKLSSLLDMMGVTASDRQRAEDRVAARKSEKDSKLDTDIHELSEAIRLNRPWDASRDNFNEALTLAWRKKTAADWEFACATARRLLVADLGKVC